VAVMAVMALVPVARRIDGERHRLDRKRRGADGVVHSLRFYYFDSDHQMAMFFFLPF
jgi:hypothetical protein